MFSGCVHAAMPQLAVRTQRSNKENAMALFLLKPILWNTNGYQRPSGWKVSGESYPAQHGFGHEEWNNSSALFFEEDGQRYRTFHTERFGKAATEENRGQTFVFMIASHDGVQQLVGVAGNAHYIGGHSGDDPYLGERKRIAKKLDLAKLGEQAWEQPRVRAAAENSRNGFNAVWKKHVSWIPNWICPEEFFWWPQQPVTLQAASLTGANKLPTMYSIHMGLDLALAEAIMSAVPTAQRDAGWSRLVDAMRIAPVDPVPPEVEDRGVPNPTTRLSLGLARIGQGKFRQDLLNAWGGACAVTGIAYARVLRASHIKPWSESTDEERLDPNNGLLLCANIDALFDAKLIAFNMDGSMDVSPEIDAQERLRLGIPRSLRVAPNWEQADYLEQHWSACPWNQPVD